MSIAKQGFLWMEDFTFDRPLAIFFLCFLFPTATCTPTTTDDWTWHMRCSLTTRDREAYHREMGRRDEVPCSGDQGRERGAEMEGRIICNVLKVFGLLREGGVAGCSPRLSFSSFLSLFLLPFIALCSPGQQRTEKQFLVPATDDSESTPTFASD